MLRFLSSAAAGWWAAVPRRRLASSAPHSWRLPFLAFSSLDDESFLLPGRSSSGGRLAMSGMRRTLIFFPNGTSASHCWRVTSLNFPFPLFPPDRPRGGDGYMTFIGFAQLLPSSSLLPPLALPLLSSGVVSCRHVGISGQDEDLGTGAPPLGLHKRGAATRFFWRRSLPPSRSKGSERKTPFVCICPPHSFSSLFWQEDGRRLD